MVLPPPGKPRKANHRRTIHIESFECVDGTVDIELRLVDTKYFKYVDRERGTLEMGDPVHAINVRISINQDLEVLAIETDLEAMPFSYCQLSAVNIDMLLGKQLNKGWRYSVREALGSTNGCTHLAELLPLASTVAFQTQAISSRETDRVSGRQDALQTKRPFYVGACHSWALDSPITRKYFPQFNEPAPEIRRPGEEKE
jgi:hypothetical protein